MRPGRPDRPAFGARPQRGQIIGQPQRPVFGARPERGDVIGQPERPVFGARPERDEIIGQPVKPEINYGFGQFGGPATRPATAQPFLYSRKGAYRPNVITARHIVPTHGYYAVADKVDETIRASCEFDFLGNMEATGRISLSQAPGDMVNMIGEFDGVSLGQHALKVHAVGDLTDGCRSTGGVFNPYGIGMGHSHYDIDRRRVGDIPQLMVMDKSEGLYANRDALISLSGPDSIIGRAIVLYEGADDHNMIDREATEWRGAIERKGMIAQIGCCVVGLAKGEKDAIKEKYSFSATATNSLADAHRAKIEKDEWDAAAPEREAAAAKERESLDMLGAPHGRFARW